MDVLVDASTGIKKVGGAIREINVPATWISQIIHGKRGITVNTASPKCVSEKPSRLRTGPRQTP